MNGYSETRSREEGVVKIAPQAASVRPTTSSSSLDTDAIIAKVDFIFLTIPCFFLYFFPAKVLFIIFTKLNSYLFPRLGAGRPQTDHSDHSQPVCLAGMKSSSLHSAFKKYISNSILEYHLKHWQRQIGPDVELQGVPKKRTFRAVLLLPIFCPKTATFAKSANL